MKPYLIVFTENNARIVKDPDAIEALKGKPNSYFKPDLSRVKGIPPHLWSVLDGEIVPMHEDHREERIKLIRELGAINDIGFKIEHAQEMLSLPKALEDALQEQVAEEPKAVAASDLSDKSSKYKVLLLVLLALASILSGLYILHTNL
jgi:hypothetical protein